jgi:hypothetical protein
MQGGERHAGVGFISRVVKLCQVTFHKLQLSNMLDQFTKLIHVAAGFTIDIGSHILTHGEKHEVQRYLLHAGIPKEKAPDTISNAQQYCNLHETPCNLHATAVFWPSITF